MILYLPEIYEDETMFSYLSRAYEKGGYISQIQALGEFLKNPNERRLEFVFCNNLSTEIIDYLTKNCKWETFLRNHTLCNYYGRYLKIAKRREAMQALTLLKGNYVNLFSITPIRDRMEYLKYCPMCVKEHREKYGETYWNRIHQVPEIKVCPKHKCRLLNSTVIYDRHKVSGFVTAESEITNLESEKGTELESKLAEYIEAMVRTPVKIYANLQPGEFLVSQMNNTPYLSNRGQVINITILYEKMMEFYESLDNGISMKWQISKVLHGERINPYEIIQIGVFLGIPVKELMECRLPFKKPEEDFDDRVIEMLRSDISAYQISRDLGVSNALINLIRSKHGVPNYKDDRYVTNKRNNKEQKVNELRKIWIKTMAQYPGYTYTQICNMSEYKSELHWLRRNDYEWTERFYPKAKESRVKIERIKKLDNEYYPKMETIISEYREKDGEMPKRITLGAINRAAGLNNRDLYNMKKCRKIVEKYEETQEGFWARKIFWAISIIEKEGKALTWNHIHKKTHISASNFQAHDKYFREKLGDEVIDAISPR